MEINVGRHCIKTFKKSTVSNTVLYGEKYEDLFSLSISQEMYD